MLYLHIGRNKSGSSSIQRFVFKHAQFMREQGVHCPVEMTTRGNAEPLVAALSDSEKNGHPLAVLRDALEQRGRVFVSSEYFLNMDRPAIERLKALIGDIPIKLLIYLRDCANFAPSIYAQATKKGLNTADFDAYFGSIRDTLSVKTDLCRWAEVFGWGSLRVKPLLQQNLRGGNLLTDLMSALDVGAPHPEDFHVNNSPHWIALELQRALAQTELFSKVELRVTLRLFETALLAANAPIARYLTADQADQAWRLFVDDLDFIAQKTGQSFDLERPSAMPRAFLPSVEYVPTEILVRIRALARTRRFAARLSHRVDGILGDIQRRVAQVT